jgi:hypothetical protein
MADHQGPEIQVQLYLIAKVNILTRFCILKTFSTGMGWDGRWWKLLSSLAGLNINNQGLGLEGTGSRS